VPKVKRQKNYHASFQGAAAKHENYENTKENYFEPSAFSL
jgi:hypothetical protein